MKNKHGVVIKPRSPEQAERILESTKKMFEELGLELAPPVFIEYDPAKFRQARNDLKPFRASIARIIKKYLD